MLEYAEGVLDVLEKNIFDKFDQKRMLLASSREEALKVLFDTDLSEGENIEEVLEKDINNLKDILFNMLKDNCLELFYFLFLRLDALNLKTSLKKEESLKLNNDYMIKMFELCNLEQGTIDERVDKAYLKTKFLIAKKIKGLALDIIKFEIDISNLKNLIKGKDYFLKGGNLSKIDILKLLGKRKGMISKGLEKFLEAFNLSILIEKFKETGSESDLEKGLEKFLSNRILKREREGGGMEKVIGFFTRKINAHSNIRLILFQKISGVATKEIESNFLPL